MKEIDSDAESLVAKVVAQLLEKVEASGKSRAELLRCAGLGDSFLRDLKNKSAGLQLRNLFKLLICLDLEPTSFLGDALEGVPVGKGKHARPRCVQKALEGRSNSSPRAESVRRRFKL